MRRLALALGKIAVITAAACVVWNASDSAALDSALADLRAKAKVANETEVVMYTAYPNFQPVWQAFMAEFPEIKVTVNVMFGAVMFSRIGGEVTSGNHAGDLTMSAFTDQDIMIKNGWLQPDVPPTIGGLPESLRHPGGYYQIPFTNLFTMVYNTNLVPANEVPKTFNEVLAPKWKGKVTFTKLNGVNVVDICIATLMYNKAVTIDELNTLKENAILSTSNSAELASVGEGRAAFGLWAPSHSAAILAKEGAPIKIGFLPDSSVSLGPGLSLLKTSPHPNAAKLLKAWLYTPEGQAALARTNSYGTMPNAPTPEGFPDLAKYHMKELPPDQASQILADFRKTSLAIWGP